MPEPEYLKIPIVEVARRCGIQVRPEREGRTEVLAHCPFCEAHKDHLYLNTVKDVFYCQDCGARGNSITLYARIMGVDNKTAYRQITGGKIGHFPIQNAVPKAEPYMAPLAVRHDVYYDMLSMMTLFARHRDNLRRRGLSDERIDDNMYRSVPLTATERQKIAGELARHYDLHGVPGFYTRYGKWQLWGKPGILIPICTAEGYIQGLQIRLDQPPDDRKKFRWLSSNPEFGYENGTPARTWVHIAGNVERSTACITEGALKGDVSSFLLHDNSLFLCVPGTGSIEFLPAALKSLHITRAVACYDMDKLRNEHVRRDLITMQNLLEREGVSCCIGNWSNSYKGIDDYYYALRQAQTAGLAAA